MIDTTTALLVGLFFFHGALASLMAGFHFWPKKDHTVKFFGLALIFNGLAFTTWALLALNHLNNLRVLASLAAVFVILALLSFYVAGIQHLQDTTSYGSALFVGVVAAFGLFILRTFIYPAHLIVTGGGFLLFELRLPVQLAYVFVLVAAVFPAMNAMAGKFKSTGLRSLIKACFTTLAIGGILLVTSTNTNLLLVNGIAMSVAFLLLWTTLLTRSGQKALDKIT